MENKRQVKSWVAATTLIIAVVSLIGITVSVANNLFKNMNTDNMSYVLRDIASDTIPVNSEVKKTTVKPFTNETVTIHIGYYDNDDEAANQEKALILYENTYMPNTGILYGCEEKFEVVSFYEGEVIAITEDDVFGTIVEIKHANNIVSKYSSLSTINVSVGDIVGIGEVIGESGNNKVVSVSQNMLLFELLYDGTNVNPEKYYELELTEMSQ